MGTYLNAGGQAYYVMGDTPSKEVAKLAKTVDGGTLPDRLTRETDELPDFELLGGLFGVGFILAIIGSFVAFFVGLFSEPVGWTIFYISIGVGGFVGVVIPVLFTLYCIMSIVVQNKVKSTTDWRELLKAHPAVVSLSDDVRPAVAALGNSRWYEKNAEEFGEAIDWFLIRPEIKVLEGLMAQPGVLPELSRKSEAQLKRVAEGSVQAAIKARDADMALEQASAAELNNAALKEHLESQVETIVTFEDVVNPGQLR